MNDAHKPIRARFGAALGLAPGGVPAYSSDYATVDERELPNRRAYRSYVDGLYMGYKWQCVEFARRWLYVNRGCVFDDVAMAYDIFRIRSLRDVRTGALNPLRSFRNGARRHPEPGCLLIWDEGGEFEITGHVAVVTEVTSEYVRVAEQNVGDRVWLEGRNYAREIRAQVSDTGEYWLECSFGDATILGWVVETEDKIDAEPLLSPDKSLFNLAVRTREARAGEAEPRNAWLNVANKDEAAYVAMMGGHKLSTRDEDRFTYYCASETVQRELRHATNQLHALFLQATDHVLRDDARLERFNIPRSLWPKIHQSWDNRRTQMITGRFDFSVSDRGLKVYEYNCDSASCHIECGKIQGKWAENFGCDEGFDPGAHLHERLRDSWRHANVGGILHIMHDDDLEETYHALFMQEAMEEAGIESKILHGVAGLSFDDEGNVLDPDGLRIRWVWKTWAWETALDQIRLECEDDEERLRSYHPGERRGVPPRLVDVLLRQDVMVFEPLWTLIPSNKAILPVLSEMYPSCPYLLKSSYTLTDELRQQGYVSKPIVGRGGANISIYDRNENLVADVAGGFDKRDPMYQELFELPSIGGYNVQVSTFTASGRFAGTCIRVDESMVINMQSDNLALRIVDDDEIRENARQTEVSG